MITNNLPTLKIHKLSQAQYDRELQNGTLDENAIYLTPDEGVDLSTYETIANSNSKLQEAKQYTDDQIATIPAPIDYTVTCADTDYEATSDAPAFKRHTLTQNGETICTIDIPKELVVEAGSVKEVTEAGKPYDGAVVGDKYIELVIANQDAPIYVPAKDLVDIYTAQAGAAEVQVAISNTNEISATLTDAVKEKLNKVHTHIFVESELNKIADGDVAKWNAAEGKAHEHTNKELLDSYTQTEANLADAVAKKHEHENASVLGGISAEKVAAWDKVSEKANDADLATVAKSGLIDDLSIGDGTVLIFDCGNSAV